MEPETAAENPAEIQNLSATKPPISAEHEEIPYKPLRPTHIDIKESSKKVNCKPFVCFALYDV